MLKILCIYLCFGKHVINDDDYDDGVRTCVCADYFSNLIVHILFILCAFSFPVKLG